MLLDIDISFSRYQSYTLGGGKDEETAISRFGIPT